MTKKMKNTFGQIKSKILKKITESYATNDKKTIKDILSIVNENKDFKELYLFYDNIENIELSYPGAAELYIETIEKPFNGKMGNITETYAKLSKYLDNVEADENTVYNDLDVLSEETTLNNLDKKVIAKKRLIDFLKTKKEISESKNYTANDKLLATILSTDFNGYYSRVLSEDDKKKLKDILNLNNDDIATRSKELSEDILGKISKILSESTDDELKTKLKNVEEEIQNIKPTKYNYYKLMELKNGLD
jgi:DNA-binding ferritin-like protein